MLEFRVLGPVEVVGDDGPLRLSGQKQRALLALLLVHAGEVLSTDRIVEELWGGEPPRTAPTSLTNFVSQLRRLLGPELLVTRPPGYVLRIERDRLDSARFERLVAEARALDADARALRLRDALALWRGPPLADVAYESFAAGEIRRLEELRLEALEERVAADLELGKGGELVPELEALVREHGLRERLRGELMLALYRAGRQAEALKAYHDARATLADELGIDPGPELQQLYRSILRQEAGLRPTRDGAGEADHLDALLEAVLAGRVVPVLGVGVNCADGEAPSSADLGRFADHLAARFRYPPGHPCDLARVAEFVALTQGLGPLYDELHALCDDGCAPGPVHRALAGLAVALRERGAPCQLVVTTNFDDALEQAFADAGEEFDVVSYLAVGRHRGKFLHLPPGGPPTVVEVPNAYAELAPDRRTVILKIHGRVDRLPAREWESFVVSEDDHIDYLADAEIASAVPVTLAARLRRSHYAFLGYPVREWSLRVFLHRVWGREKVAYRSWAVGPQHDVVERELWRQRGIEVLDLPLEEYAAQLEARLHAEVAAGR